jgi:hypothetical protein
MNEQHSQNCFSACCNVIKRPIATEDESWFRYVYPAPGVTSLLASAVESAHHKFWSQFFTGTRLFVLKALPKGRKFDQDYFLEEVLPSPSRRKRSNRRKKLGLDFIVHMDNSMCYNARKISLGLEHNKIQRTPHPTYSPDISPCDF